jgi:hypothetical protein
MHVRAPRHKNFPDQKFGEFGLTAQEFVVFSVACSMRHVVAEIPRLRWTARKLVLPFACVEMTRPPKGVEGASAKIKRGAALGTKEE